VPALDTHTGLGPCMYVQRSYVPLCLIQTDKQLLTSCTIGSARWA